MRLSIRKNEKKRLEKFKFIHFSMWVQCMCTPGYPTCVCIRGWRPMCMWDVQVRWRQMTTCTWQGRWWGQRIMPTVSAQSYTRWGGGFLLLYSILLFDVRILNVALYVSRCGMYACVRRWAICVRPRGVWLSTGIDVRLRRASKMYMTVLVSILRVCMRIDDVRFFSVACDDR